MSTPTPMGVYAGHLRIGEITDGGNGRVRAIDIEASGRRVDLGFYPTRRDAMRAISERHAGGPEPSRAA